MRRLDGLLRGIRRCGTRPLPATLVLFVAYLAMGALADPGGTLGADTGAKVYTLEVMDRHDTYEPDIGYWAEELDPDGNLHPVHHTTRRSDGSWVAVTTLPMLEAAHPLYQWGGYRAALLLPMAAAVGAAWAARAVSRRIRPGDDGWSAFWIIGLGSPVVVYALDFWEHTAGLACTVGAVAVLLAVWHGRPPLIAVGAGMLFGAGAVMRNEALVYALVVVGTVCAALLWRDRRPWRSFAVGTATLVGFAGPWFANAALESAVGGQSRATRATGRASSTGSSVGGELGRRVEEGLQTLVGLVSGDPALSVLLGAAVVGVLLAGARAERRGDRAFANAAFAAVVTAYLADAIGGLGFIPGLLVAFPLAVGGLLPRRNGSRGTSAVDTGTVRMVVVIALVALPLVYLFQFLGASGPQWGGRYSLASGTLLGLVALVRTGRRTRRALVALSFGVTALGVGWVWERSHSVTGFFDEVIDESADVVIARQAFLIREAGAEAVGRRWLSTENEAEFTAAIDLVRQLAEERFTVLEWEGEAPPPTALPPDVREVRRRSLDFATTPVGVVTYAFTAESRER